MRSSSVSRMGSSQKTSKGKRQDNKAHKGKDVEISDALIAHRDRLRQALVLGIRSDNKGGRQWLSTDAMISSRAVKMMSGFIDHLSPKLLYHSMIKDSVGDMLVAVEGILQIENETVLRPAVILSTKLLEYLGSSLFRYQFSGVVSCLSWLLSSNQLAIVISSAKSLNVILGNIGASRRIKKEIWYIFEEEKTIACIISSLRGHESGVQPVEHLLDLVHLLKDIVWIWPMARYSVWNKIKMMENLGHLCATLDVSTTAGILQLYSAVALCDDVARNFVESKQPFISNLLLCMGSSVPIGIRVEAFRLCQQLVRSEEVCLSLTALCGEEIVQRIIDSMGGWRSVSVASLSPDQGVLMKEVCCTAQMTRWVGKHHCYFWKHGIDKALFELLGHYGKIGASQGPSKVEEFRRLRHHNFPEITDSIWDILWCLSMNCCEEFFSNITTDLHCANAIASFACSLTVDGMLKEKHFHHSSDKLFTSSMLLPLFRATLSMIFSPCKSFALHARSCMSKMLRHDDFRDYLNYILEFFSVYAGGKYTMAHDNNQVLLRLMALACYSSLSEHQIEITQKGGLDTLLIMLKACIRRKTHPNRTTSASHGHNCYYSGDEDRESEDSFLLYILQALSQLIPHQRISLEKVSIAKYDNLHEESLPDCLLQILENDFSRAVKWYSAYCLSFLGLYGFPSKIGKRMRMAFDDSEWRDLQLILSNKEVVGVHQVILMSRCPSLLSPTSSSGKKKSNNFFSEELVSSRCLSSRVERPSLEKLLEFVYTGFFQVGENDLQSVRILAKSCGLESLYQMLQRKLPFYASPLPIYDFTSALTPLGHVFSDVILEGKELEAFWTCSMCQLSTPHIHAHKIILSLNSAYFQALFHSGMQESSRNTVKVPLSWMALDKLLHWFYSGELPGLKFNCEWANVDQQTQLDKLLIYLEISELAEIWFLDEVREKSIDIVVSCLKLNRVFPIKIVQSAYNLRQCKVLEVALNCLAPLYNQLHNSGELDEFDEELVEMLREEYVAYSLEGHEARD